MKKVIVMSKEKEKEIKRYVIKGSNQYPTAPTICNEIKLKVKAENDGEALNKAKALASRNTYKIVEIKEL